MDAIEKFVKLDDDTLYYNKALRPIAGSVLGSIVLAHAIKLWIKNDKQPFLKFRDKPSMPHQNYKDGTSWVEELGFSQAKFDQAMKILTNSGYITKRVTISRETFYTVQEKAINNAITAQQFLNNNPIK